MTDEDTAPVGVISDDQVPEGVESQPPDGAGFAVRLDNFEGPFDLLLSLIGKHKLDVTEVALSRVTDEFIAYIREAGADEDGAWDLDQTTSFLVVASTLLDLKAARLLPQGDIEDEEDLALLEARDLLFARLLQYKAFKQVASVLESHLDTESRRYPRSVGLEDRFSSLLPEVLIGLGLQEFAGLAARALQPRPEPELGLGHIHAPAVSVREQAMVVMGALRSRGTMTFRALASDAPDTMTRVARFLALLELFREEVVAFDQMSPLGELTIRWTADEDAEVEITDEFEGAPPGESPDESPDGSPEDSPEQPPTTEDEPEDEDEHE
ncbi:MAG: segregation and condensation protein A [Marmoricola sp.]